MTFHSPIEPSAQSPEASASAGAPPANLPALIAALPGDETRAPQTEFTRARQTAFLSALAECGGARGAARAAGVSHQSAYRMRRANPAFRLAWDAALIAARVPAEDVLACRALDGVEEEVFYHGEVVATRRRYDSRLLLAHLARLDRLTADARANAFAEDFEAALERFAQGSDTPEIDPAALKKARARKNDPGQCNTRSKSDPAAEGARPPDGQKWCPYAQRYLPEVDRLLNAMDATRPDGARRPEEFGGYSPGEVEAEQWPPSRKGWSAGGWSSRPIRTRTCRPTRTAGLTTPGTERRDPPGAGGAPSGPKNRSQC